MADDCEISSEVTDRWLAGRIAAAMAPPPKDMFAPNGRCRWCLEKVADGLTFCPAEDGDDGCEGDWKRDQVIRQRTGRI